MSITVQRKSGCKCITIAPTCHYPQWWHWRCVQRVAVRRKHILQDTLDTLKRIPWKATKYMKVAFIGEPGVDDGGTRQEFFRLLLESIGRRNMHFWGLVGRHIPSWQPTKIESFTLVKSLARWAICQVVGPIGFQESPKAIRLLNPQKPPTPGTLQDLFTLDWPTRGPTGWCGRRNSTVLGHLLIRVVKMVAYLFKMTIHRHQPIWWLCKISWTLSQTQLKSPYRLVPTLTISFSITTQYPIASTCSNCLLLPLGQQYKDVRHNIAFGIKNSPGFQRLWL